MRDIGGETFARRSASRRRSAGSSIAAGGSFSRSAPIQRWRRRSRVSSRARHARVSVLPSLRRMEDERATLLSSLGTLHKCGIAVAWQASLTALPRRVALPTYAWQRERFWHESEESRRRRLDPPTPPLLGRAAAHRRRPLGKAGSTRRRCRTCSITASRIMWCFPLPATWKWRWRLAEGRLGSRAVDARRRRLPARARGPGGRRATAPADACFKPTESSFAISSSAANGTTWIDALHGQAPPVGRPGACRSAGAGCRFAPAAANGWGRAISTAGCVR